jgi:hypothetical protein
LLAKERANSINYDLLLVRPDLHEVWRGNDLPQDAAKIAMVATGRFLSGI